MLLYLFIADTILVSISSGEPGAFTFGKLFGRYQRIKPTKTLKSNIQKRDESAYTSVLRKMSIPVKLSASKF